MDGCVGENQDLRKKTGGASSKLGKSSTKIAQPHDFIKHSIKAKSRKNAEFQRFYEAGLSLRQIEDRTGVSKTKIRQELEGLFDGMKRAYESAIGRFDVA